MSALKRIPWPGVAVLVALVLAMPLVLPPFGLTIATEILVMAIFAMSLGVIIGYAGLVSLGHAAFFGAGAYTLALLGERVSNSFVLLAAAVLVAGVLALVSGALFVRTSGAYFLMLTLAFGQVLYAVAFQAQSVTGGSDGMGVSAAPNFGFGEVLGDYALYYMMAAAFLLCYLLLRLFVASPAGKAVRGVMENEGRMRALGYDVRLYKLLAYTLSGAMAGLAGALYAYFSFYVTADLMGWVFSGQALIMVIVGGAGTLLGPALGAGVFILLQNYLASYTERWPLIMGLVFVAFVLIGRGGIFDLLTLAWRRLVPARFRGGSEGEAPPSPPEPAPTPEKEKAL